MHKYVCTVDIMYIYVYTVIILYTLELLVELELASPVSSRLSFVWWSSVREASRLMESA